MKVYETLESGIKIIEYDPSFAPSLAEMWNMCNQSSEDDWGGGSGISTADQVISEHAMASFFNVYLALDGDDVVGYCSLGRYFADADALYVALLGTRPDYRSKKIGKALVLRCVERTIERGYPRLDLFTWSGNTAAVPLYKKCGFLWEDRPDSTHFVNFLPTILKSSIFTDFFKKADWYDDSVRSLEIVPDGEKVNGFELFGYSWEKDGDSLSIGYERTGRQMRMIETADYKIELMAQNHELAFGMDYDCKFFIENKTGEELNIKITGRESDNIKLDYNFDMQVVGQKELDAKFHVGKLEEPQDVWKVHPCLLANIEINGHTAVFGLGINAKFPLLVNFNRECLIDQVGMDVKTHIDIQSSLSEDAALTINIPPGKILDITKGGNSHTVEIPAKGKVSIPITSTVLDIGFEKLELSCIAAFKDGRRIDLTVPAFILTRDLTQAFCAKTLNSYSIYNGPWALTFANDNEVGISHLINKIYMSEYAFQPPKLGKPYDDEFNLIKPNIKTYQQASAMIMEAEYVSEKFPGMVVTQVYSLFASGLVTRANRVENRSDKPRHGVLQDSYILEIGFNSVFSYNGQVTQNHTPNNSGSILEGFDNVSMDNVDENWVFEDSHEAPRGYCWPKEYKPAVKWGSHLSFEIDLGELAPGQVFESKPVTYAMGLFTAFNDLRNYAKQTYSTSSVPTVHTMEVVLNEYNPFVASSEIALDIINNRSEVQEGTITVSSESLEKTLSQTNPHEEIVEKNSFSLPVCADSIAVVNIAMNMVGYEKAYSKAIFFPSGGITTAQEDTLYSVSNGAICFKADPNYGHGCFSLTDAKGQEWLLSQYPEHKPYSWFNPFIGGIRVRIEDVNDMALLKEKTSVDFVEMHDNLGNLWKGLCVTLSMEEDENLKGSVYKSFYLTQPGIPVLCTFFKFENSTGEYKNTRTWISTCLKPDEDFKKIVVEVTDKDYSRHCRRMGSIETPEVFFEGTVKISGSRAERLYALCSDNGTDYGNDFWGTHKIPVMATFSHSKARAAHGETFTSNPAFIVITDKNLPQGALDDLERIKF